MGAFIPQEGITQGILSAIQMANQQHQAQQENAARQQQLSIAQTEANTASQRLGIETPEIQARTAGLKASTALTNVDLAQKQAAIHFLNGTNQSPDVDPNHVDQLTSQIAGPHAQTLNVSDPMEQQNAQPAPPASGPTATVQPKGADAYIQALDKKVGLLPEERQAIDNARTLAAPTGDVAGFQKQVQAIVDKRNDPAYARYVAFRNQGLSADAAHQKIAQVDARNAALTKIETDPGELSGEKAPAAVSQLQGMLKSADDTEKPRIQSLLTTAKTAVAANLAFDSAKKKADKAAQDGDPIAAGHLLATRQVAPNEITTGRNSAFAVQAFSAARKEEPNYNPQQAQAEFDVAKSPTNVGFFGSAKSLTDKGGTLDQLIEQGKRLGNGQIPAFNSVEQLTKMASGGGAQAHYAATVLGVADDLAKVLGGGAGTDASRQEAFGLVSKSLNNAQRGEAVEGIRAAVNSQMNSRIGSNSVLRNMYGGGVSSEGPVSGGSAKKSDPLGIF